MPRRATKKADPVVEAELENLEDDDQEEEEKPRRLSRVERKLKEDDDTDVKNWLDSLQGEQDIVIKVYRMLPKSWGPDNVNIEGKCDEFNEAVSEDEIRARHGGGTFKISIFRPNSKGSLVYYKSRNIKIPGPPKLPWEEAKVSALPVDTGNSELASQAMRTMKEIIDQGKAQPVGGFDMGMFQAFQQPMMEQIRQMNEANNELRRDLAEKDARIVDLLSRKPDTSDKDMLINKMWDGENARLESLRAQHDSERRMLSESFNQQIQRLQDQHKEDLRDRQRAHERELDNLKVSTQTQIESIKVSYEARIDGLKSEMARLERDLSKIEAETGVLRAKKDKSLTEQAAEIVQMQEQLKILGIGGKDDDEPDNRKWYEKAMGMLADNPEVLQQILGGQPPSGNQQQVEGAPQQQMIEPPPGVPFRTEPDGPIYIKKEDGTVIPYKPKPKANPLGGATGNSEPSGDSDIRPPAPHEVALAVSAMEGAFANATPPEVFAQTARALVPTDILRYIEAQGVDNFLNEVAKLEPGSPLRNQAGREYMRQVAKVLLEAQ